MRTTSGNQLGLSLVILVVWAMTGWFGGPLLNLLGEATRDLGGIAIPKTLLAVVILLIGVSALFEAGDLGLAAPRPAKSVRLIWLPLLYIVAFISLAVVSGFPSLDVALPLLISTSLGAVSQELMFRGILFAGLRSRFSVIKTVWVSSLASAFAWMPVWLCYGEWERGVGDMIQGLFLGLLFAALRVRTGSLYLCILLHAVWSYALFLFRLSAGGLEWTTLLSSVAVLPLPLYGLYLLRPKASAATQES